MKANTVGRWENKRVFVPNEGVTKEQVDEHLESEKMDQVLNMISAMPPRNFAEACNRVEEFTNYFPGSNKVPDGGAWVLVKNPPHCQYTVPPLSIWFAEPWPITNERHCSHRVKIITPLGELGLFPREYSLVTEPQKYYEFIGDGMNIRFFGNADDNLPKELRDKLFYIRSRGVAKKDALALLVGSVKAHGVLWIESTREVCASFGMEWPSNLATQ